MLNYVEQSQQVDMVYSDRREMNTTHKDKRDLLEMGHSDRSIQTIDDYIETV